jgi:hypothetical protein
MQERAANKDMPFSRQAATTGRQVAIPPDPLIVGTTDHVIGRDTRIIDKSTHPDLKRGRADQPVSPP